MRNVRTCNGMFSCFDKCGGEIFEVFDEEIDRKITNSVPSMLIYDDSTAGGVNIDWKHWKDEMNM